MVILTRMQRVALAKIYTRTPLEMTYLTFRRKVQGTIGMDGTVVVQWQGMWLCIDRDGYTHS